MRNWKEILATPGKISEELVEEFKRDVEQVKEKQS